MPIKKLRGLIATFILIAFTFSQPCRAVSSEMVAAVSAGASLFGILGLILLAKSKDTGTTTTATTPESTTTIALFDSNGNLITTGEIKVESEISPQTYKFTNTGSFDWLNPSISSLSLPGVTLSDVCDRSVAIPPGGSCSFTLTTSSSARPGSSAEITASGANIAPVDTNIIVRGGFAITPELGADNLHLGYRAIKLENMTTSNANVTQVQVLESLTNVKQCLGDADCAYQTDPDCDTTTGTISAGGICRLWFKATSDGTTPFGTEIGPIKVTVRALWPESPIIPIEETENFIGNFNFSLYAGGSFSTPANFIARWNGSTWSAFNTEPSGFVKSFALLKGDLYTGGFFLTAGGVGGTGKIAKWNGANWSPLGSSGAGGSLSTVDALTVLGTDLYAGGSFTDVGGVTALFIAKWNGLAWSALDIGVDSSVHALTTSGGVLYAGGNFHIAGGTVPVSVNNIAVWNGTAWSALGAGMNNEVDALTTLGTDLYAGGNFTTAGGNPASFIAVFIPNSWFAVPAGGMNSTVLALITVGGDIYAGGNFTIAGAANPANFIAKLNNTAFWSALGSGMNSTVRALVAIGTNLYAGGDFTTAGGDAANRVAKWNSTALTWSPLGTGIGDGSVNALIAAPGLVITKP